MAQVSVRKMVNRIPRRINTTLRAFGELGKVLMVSLGTKGRKTGQRDRRPSL
jgi:hypothetical protein